MENIFKYYDFSDFFKDESDTFSNSEICYTILNEQHFLIFERTRNDDVELYTLYISKYKSEKEIGSKAPEILEKLVERYDKSKPEHRVALSKYIY